MDKYDIGLTHQYKIKASVKQGMQGIKEMQSGKRDEQELRSFLDEL